VTGAAIGAGSNGRGGGSVLALCYHAIADHADDPVIGRYSVPPALFAAHLDQLMRRGFTFIDGDQLLGWLHRGVALPTRPALLTFDDCYEDLLDTARNILVPRRIPALAFAVSGAESNLWDQPAGARQLKLMDWRQLAQLAELGVELGSHSATHRRLPDLGAEGLRLETDGAASAFERHGLRRPRFFAYPFGQVSDAAQGAVRDAGFDGAFGIDFCPISPMSDLYALPRFPIMATDRGWRFRFRTSRLFAARRMLSRALRRYRTR
jgi:peptidoglycan/xylan/chitin deacetylase (PgdA/CDA1 family)